MLMCISKINLIKIQFLMNRQAVR